MNNINQKRPSTGCLQETHFRDKDTQKQSERLQEVISHKWKQRESNGSNTHIRQNRLYIKVYNKDPGHYIMIKASTQEEDTTFIKIYVPNIVAQ